jgi:hypothetical protein
VTIAAAPVRADCTTAPSVTFTEVDVVRSTP